MNAPMLGMQSANWHAKASHSRGYAANDVQKFQEWCSLWLAECFRVLKPGGHMIAFGGTRTWHRLAVAAEDCGFEIRDSLAWLYGTGFPKSLDVGAAVANHRFAANGSLASKEEVDAWAGWGTTLKPAHEPIVLARKPLDGTVASNALAHETGALNIRGCEIADQLRPALKTRWPSNAFLDVERAASLDAAAGEPVSRFFWVAKPTGTERVRVGGVSHPTVKPLDLMRELTRLVTRPGQLVLDPFAGSGTTAEACLLEGFNVVAIERDAAYLALIRHRIDRRRDPLTAGRALEPDTMPDLFSE